MPAADVLAIDAATFAVSAATVAALVPGAAQPQHPRASEDSVAYLASLGEGFRYLLGDRLLVAIAMILVTNFVDQAGSAVLIPVWAHDILHSSVALGLVSAALSLGAVVGNAVTTSLAPDCLVGQPTPSASLLPARPVSSRWRSWRASRRHSP